MAKRKLNGTPKKKKRRLPKDRCIELSIADGGEVEIAHGSIKALAIKHGDLVIVRLAGERYHQHEINQRVLDLVEGLLVSTGRRAVALVVPADFDIENMSSAKATKVLEALAEKAG